MAVASTFYQNETLRHVDTITQSDSELDRHQAIDHIVNSDEKDKARLLIELFQYSAWRDTQGALLKAIGATQELRGVEFLIRYIRASSDLPMMAKATLGLGVSQSNLAGTFLLSVLTESDSRLQLEAIKGLTLMPQFQCDAQLIRLMTHRDSPESLKLHATIAAGRRGAVAALPVVLSFAKDDNTQSNNRTLKEAATLALGHLAGSVQVLDDIANTNNDLLFDEVITYARDRIQLRLATQVDDAILNAASEDRHDFLTRFRLLREIPITQLRGAFDTLHDTLYEQGQTQVECLLRAVLHDPHSAHADVAFLLEHQTELDINEAAVLARLCVQTSGPDFFHQFKPFVSCELLNHVQVTDIFMFTKTLFHPEKDMDLAIAFINAVVAQSLMSWRVQPSHLTFLLTQLKHQKNDVIVNRLSRALAQLGCTDADYLDTLSTSLEKEITQASAAYCLSLLPSRYSAPILLGYLEKAYDAGVKVDALLERVSLLGTIEGLHDLPAFDKNTQTRCASFLLRILSFNRVEGFDLLIKKYLTNGDHARSLLAISATTLNGNDEHREQLFPFLASKNIALKTRAAYSLCMRGDADQHTRLITWFATDAFNSSFAKLIFNKLRIRENENYTVFALQLNQLIQSRNGPFIDDEILASALSLYDNLKSSIDQGDNKADLPSQHRQDTGLSKEIRAYPFYSETIKIILRNAELTWQHSELFNHMVDKSTMLVQYSKSTDLLLQQRIGAPIFQTADDAFLSLLQTRVMELGLDTATFTQARMIRHLKLEGFFTTREFPAHKLKTLTEAIMSGKILADRFRAIDGLRAWSLILLLFARTFVINKTKFTPIIPMSKSGENIINGIVKLMNRFQDLRNSAAHHGVVVDLDTLADIRKDSFNLLNALEDVLPTQANIS